MPAEALLSNYADVAIRIGMGLEPGDRLLIHSSLEAAEFTRLLVERAYEAGAVNVDVLWADTDTERARFSHGSAEASSTVSSSTHFRMAAFEQGDLMLYVSARDPDGMAGLDTESIAAFEKVNRDVVLPLVGAQGRLHRQWSVLAAPTEAWAAKVFADDPPDEAVEKLWAAIFRACRVDRDDPVAAWGEHLDVLNARCRRLTEKQFAGLRYEGPGTDLTLGLPDRSVWIGGRTSTPGGRPFLPNIPTEEVFAAPHRLQGDGLVTATKPLSLFGNLVEGFSFEVREGRIVGASADRGQEMLDRLLTMDDGSSRFGEAAMVPMSSAVAAEELVWSNTLYDENDGCHIAIGRAYPISVAGGPDMTADELEAAGLNMSSTHVDFVVGTDQLSVFGVRSDGGEEAIIAGGEWAFDV